MKKLSVTQENALIDLFNYEGIGNSMTVFFVRQRRTLKQLEAEGLARFYPSSKLDKNGAWKITPEGRKYVEENLKVEGVKE